MIEQFGLGSLERLPQLTGVEQPIIVICGSVNGSRPVADALVDLGYRNLAHVDGGVPAWQASAVLPATE